MKTFREFILEAEIKWNTGILKGSRKSPAQTSDQKRANIARTAKTNPSPSIFARLKRMDVGRTAANILAKETDPAPQTTATRMQKTGRMRQNTGRATFKDTPTSSVGTESGIDRTGVHDLRKGGRRIGSAAAPDEVVSGRFGTVPGGGGTRVSRSGGIVGRKG